MIEPPTIPVRSCPSKETLAVLNGRPWVAAFSGGKDSTALVTWIEWLRRVGLVNVAAPRLVMSDTGVEYPFLRQTSAALLGVLRSSGWQCEVVVPETAEKLYPQIFGRGLTPTHPGNRGGRWCTRSTKAAPMRRHARGIGPEVVQLSGVRWGESDLRDGKLTAGGCAAGGECGLPAPGEGVYGPIITWRTCKVVEWLNGEVESDIRRLLADIHPITRELMAAYDMKAGACGLFGDAPKFTGLRFGCVGCPAITRDKVLRSARGRATPAWAHLPRIHGLWAELYRPANRCCRVNTPGERGYRKSKPAGWVGYGPVRMAARQRYFADLLDIQRQSGVELVTAEDERFIRDCWERQVYPKGWSAADELVEPPASGLLALTVLED